MSVITLLVVSKFFWEKKSVQGEAFFLLSNFYTESKVLITHRSFCKYIK